MPAPMTYRVVPQGEPLEGARFNGEGGVRREWWWQAGPVDSCCFCCSLRAGVGILATLDLLYKGIYGTFYSTEHMKELFHTLQAQLQSIYDRQCQGGNAQSENCEEIEHSIKQMMHGMDYVDNEPKILYLPGIIAIVAGLAGLFAVFRSNALAAKVYLWTWLPRFLAMIVAEYISHTKVQEFGLDQNPKTLVLAEIINAIFIAYYVKVLWSYHQRLKGHSGGSSLSPSDENIQLSSRYDGAV